MNIRDLIIDYEDNKADIEKWLAVKGEVKYLCFAKILQNQGLAITWKAVSELYKYDKRLLFNTFKYISFFEEFIRAIIVNNAVNKQKAYKSNNGIFFKYLINNLLHLNINLGNYFDCENIENKLSAVNALRNQVAHNKIIIEFKDYKKAFQDFYSLLPLEYRDNFKSDINSCTSNLEIPSTIGIFENTWHRPE